MQALSAQLDMTVVPDLVAPHVVVDGVVDDSNCKDLAATLDGLMHRDHTCVVVDLDRVRFMDSAAVRVLVRAQEKQRSRRRDLRIGSVSEPVRHLFTVLQLGYMLPFAAKQPANPPPRDDQEARRRVRALFDPPLRRK